MKIFRHRIFIFFFLFGVISAIVSCNNKEISKEPKGEYYIRFKIDGKQFDLRDQVSGAMENADDWIVFMSHGLRLSPSTIFIIERTFEKPDPAVGVWYDEVLIVMTDGVSNPIHYEEIEVKLKFTSITDENIKGIFEGTLSKEEGGNSKTVLLTEGEFNLIKGVIDQ